MDEKRFDEIILAEGIEARATDIHIDPMIDAYSVRMRIDGKLRLWKSFSKEDGTRLVNQVKADMGIDAGVIFEPVSVRTKIKFQGRLIDLRVSLAPCISGPKLAIRILDNENIHQKMPTLGLTDNQSEQLKRWLAELNGIFLVTGPTGSGKTTTAYALLDELVSEDRHVVTIEDPVEYELDGINQIEVNHNHNLTFAEGVKSSLRMDPDCLMVGEIREPETAKQAINAAVLGHVIIATMHSRDAVSIVTALRNFGLADHQIAAALGVVVNQRLVAKLCRNCVKQREVSPVERSFFEARFAKCPEEVYYSEGCSECDETGINGRTGIYEVWNLDDEGHQLILAGADEDKIRSRLLESGHVSLLDDAISKVEAGLISADEVMRTGLSLPWMNK